MKALITLLGIICIHATFGQSLTVGSYLEQTFTSPKIGTSFGYNFPGNFEVGGFIQRSASTLEMEGAAEPNYEKEFWGAYMTYPIVNGYKTSVQFKVRTGVTNSENFSITPSMHASYKVTNAISLGGGVGVRAFNPTFMASVSFNLNQPKNEVFLTSLD